MLFSRSVCRSLKSKELFFYMPIKILINGITLEGANIVPLLLKVKIWQSNGAEITFLGNSLLHRQIDSLNIIKKYSYIELKNTRRIKSRIHLIFEGLRRNYQVLFYIRQLKNKFDIVYSISSVLDLMIFPYIFKKFDKKILRLVVFDNIVPITDPGNRLIRFIAWVFFRISVILLKNVDCIFTGSKDLEKFLIGEGIDKQKIIERGQAVRNDMIRRAKANPKYKIDALFVGRINETKGIYDMLKVLEIVKIKYPNFQLALIGTGDKSIVRRYKNKIKQRKMEKNIQFLGLQTEENKFDIMKSSRCFWFLSVSQAESWGIALLEAVCCGKPAFVYNLPAYNYYRNNEIFTFTLHDYRAIAKKVIEIFDKKEFDNKNGRLLIDKYSWEKIAQIEYNNILRLQAELPGKKRILINGITLEGANLTPLLSKVKYWQKRGVGITFFGNNLLKRQIDSLNILQKYYFLELRNTRKITSRLQLIFEGLRRNIQALSYIRQLKNKFDIIYSISSVLDLLLFPYILKKVDRKIMRVSVFDNTVPFLYSGDILISFLGWFFYQISLLFLKGADCIYVTRPQLKEHLLKKGLKENQLIVTGSTIEMGFVKTSKKDDKYRIDALFIGRINEAKGIYDMLEVLAIVKKTYPNFQLSIMGSGDERIMRKYKEKIRKANLSKNIQFLGYKIGLEKFNIIKSSKCFWFLSHTESYPLSPLEAVSCGLKTFVYDLEAYDMYKNNELIIVKKKDYARIAQKVIDIFEKKDFENKTGKLLFKKLCWSWDEIAKIEYNTFFTLRD